MFFSEETTDPSPSLDSTADTKPRILIGSQRNPDAYRPKPVVQVVDENGDRLQASDFVLQEDIQQSMPTSEARSQKPDLKTGQVVYDSEIRLQASDFRLHEDKVIPNLHANDQESESNFPEARSPKPEVSPLPHHTKIPVPTIHGDLSDDLEEEYAEIFSGNEFDTILTSADKVAAQPQIETDTKYRGTIVSIGRDSAFVELGGREQGAVPLKQFNEMPNVGDTIDVKVVRFLAEEGLYELSLPTAAADVADWSQVEEGMVVEAKVTGHNTGGLECEVNRLRAFIPMSQISVFRVENAAEFVGQKLMCIVTECNPMRRNLVLSHRALLEREREENRQKIFSELEIGQTRDGLVRKLIDTGAFIDLGGVDGFLPISALAWGRVKHPGDVISEGQRIKVRITNIDEVKNRISLNYRDESTDPWLSVEEKFAPKSAVRGKVSKIMDFGAFVELLPGVEGLVHISEISLKRVGRVTEVVQEGDWVDVMVLSVDVANRKISLSMKQCMPPVEQELSSETEVVLQERKEAPLDPVKMKTPRKGPLKGGLSSGSDGDKFGLKF